MSDYSSHAFSDNHLVWLLEHGWTGFSYNIDEEWAWHHEAMHALAVFENRQ